MKAFFEPKSVVVIGASTNPGKAGHSVLMNLVKALPNGNLWAVHPSAREISGVPCRSSLTDVPGPIDLAVICLSPDQVLPVVELCVQAKVKALIIESGSLANDALQAQKNTQTLLALLTKTKHATRVMGPNSIGVVNLGTRLSTSLIPYPYLPSESQPGVAVAGQTGLIASGYLQRIIEEKWFRLSKICCLGNKLDVNELDVLAYLKEDPNTRVIALYLEDVKDGRAFYKLLRETTKVKPVIIYKGGTTSQGARAVSSHTGSIAGSGVVFSAAIRQAGAIIARNFEELFSLADFLSKAPRPRGNRIGTISITGAGCVLTVDAAEKYGLVVPPMTTNSRKILDPIVPAWDHVDNPVDLWSTIEKAGSKQAYNTATRALLASDFDALIIINLAMPESEMDWDELARLKNSRPEIPIILSLLGGWPKMRADYVAEAFKRDIPVVFSPDDALRLLAKVLL